MKITILAPALALCGGLALAQNPGATTARPQDTQKKMTDKKAADHKLTAEVVSTDASAEQITVRKLSTGALSNDNSQDSMRTRTLPADDSSTFTLKVEGKALTRLSSVKAGDMVTISCRTLSASADTSGAMGSAITSQAMADLHCASVTDISAGKSAR